MLISHEVPISMLEDSKAFNDYDYCLLHLLNRPEYLNYYKKASESGRKVLLDNSLFELGDAMSPSRLLWGCEEIKPFWYVVPDAMNDTETTIARFENWKENYRSKAYGLAIGVVQGSTFSDLVRCYEYMANNADKVAIPFLATAYQNMFPGVKNPLEKATLGRNYLIKHLMANGIWRFDVPVHILGATLPGEFSDPLYSKYIESMDSSCPVVNGLIGKSISIDTSEKPSVRLNDLIEEPVSKTQKELVLHNVEVFRNICEHN